MIDSEVKARAKVKELWDREDLYVILSETMYENGMSRPRAYKVDDRTVYLNVFTEYDYARIYCNKSDSIIDNHCLIGRMNKNDEYTSFKNIINIALHIGIYFIDIDCVADDSMSIPIPVLMEWLGLKPEGINVLLTEEEHEKYQKEGGKFPVKFNRMGIYEPA